MPVLPFFFLSTLLLTEVTAIGGVMISSTSLVLTSGDIQEGTSQDVEFDFNLVSDAAGGSVSGNNLWGVTVFGSQNANGVGPRVAPEVVSLTPMQGATAISAGTPAVISGLAFTWDLTDGPLCSEFDYLCAQVEKNPSSSLDFTFSGTPDDSVLTSCLPVSCRGVEVTGTSLYVRSGDELVEGDSAHQITFDILVDSDAAGGSVSGTNLWQVRAYATGSNTTGGSVINPVRISLTSSQSDTEVNAGMRANIMALTADLNLRGALCTGLAGICVVLQQNPSSQPSFSFDPQPNSNVLTSCVPTTCIGVQVTNINFNIISGAPFLAGSDNNAIALELNILTDGDGAGVSGSNLWQVELFMNSQIDGQGTTTLSQLTSIPASENSQSLTAGISYTLEDVATTLNLRNMDCANLPFVCVRLSKNPGSTPAFTLSKVSPASLVSCQSLPCTDTNECDPNPCMNGGICTDRVNSFSCACPTGFTGPTCDGDIDECGSDPCFNGGTCQDEVNGYTCNCAPGWTDVNCQSDINECLLTPSPCNNNGMCINLENRFKCDCTPGWTGTRCETDINECASSPCVNGGTCNDEINQYTCVCPVGFTGLTCDIAINDCTSQPCQNGGICVDGNNAFTCQCQAGWEGVTCSEDVNECLSTPCINGGTCTHGTNIYICQCPPAWSGTNCELDINECLLTPSPCNNNGMCINLENRFRCDCSPGWTGTRCETAPVTDTHLPETTDASTQSTDFTARPVTTTEPKAQNNYIIYIVLTTVVLLLLLVIWLLLCYAKRRRRPASSQNDTRNESTAAGKDRSHGGQQEHVYDYPSFEIRPLSSTPASSQNDTRNEPTDAGKDRSDGRQLDPVYDYPSVELRPLPSTQASGKYDIRIERTDVEEDRSDEEQLDHTYYA